MKYSNLIFFIAFRYLFSKKKQNVINLISIISVIGVVVSSAALVCVLSVFNGFADMITDSFSAFEPEIKITAKEGKVFDCSEILPQISENQNVAKISQVLADNALVGYAGNQTPVILKGVDRNYQQIFEVDSLMITGEWRLYDFDFDVAAVGYGLAAMLGLGVDYVTPVDIYAPRREGKINIIRPDAAFKRGQFFVCGEFSVMQSQYDDNMLMMPIEFVRQMYDYDTLIVSSLELKLLNINNLSSTEKQLQKIAGENFSVENRAEQQKDYYKIIRIERFLVFLILIFILFIAICNIISSLSMLLIEKKENIEIFRNLGARETIIKRVFITVGWLMSVIGCISGVLLGLAVCILQQKFGFLKMNIGSFLENYPVSIHFFDIFLVIIIVLIIGFFTPFYPVRHERTKM
ncbi:MAG: ABC transporter permease [Prevotellaceae bacterium]|jgi:ABC-type lipoprotein release transport system permease subunit|nr:ABC transporter permease [Prevotellaceae bacterium]